MDMQKTAAFIAAKRKEKALTQRQLAQLLNVSDKTISKWETAKGLPDVAIIGDLCTALDITPVEFFNGESTMGNSCLIIDVADSYQKMGKKQMLCFYTFITSMAFTVVCAFFGDGFPKIAMTIAAYTVSAIAAYKLGKISFSDVKKLQKIALAVLIFTIIMTADLGINYFNALNSSDKMVSISTHFAWLIFGDYNWSLHRFLIGFKNSAGACALVLGQNLYLLSARLKNG